MGEEGEESSGATQSGEIPMDVDEGIGGSQGL
jgi:hypothetical protein